MVSLGCQYPSPDFGPFFFFRTFRFLHPARKIHDIALGKTVLCFCFCVVFGVPPNPFPLLLIALDQSTPLRAPLVSWITRQARFVFPIRPGMPPFFPFFHGFSVLARTFSGCCDITGDSSNFSLDCPFPLYDFPSAAYLALFQTPTIN